MKKLVIFIILLILCGCKNNEIQKKEQVKVNIEYKDGAYYVGNIIIVNKSYPLDINYIPFNTYNNINNHTLKCNTCINKDAYYSFQKMQYDASLNNLKLWIQSGYRSYDYQTKIYNQYKKIYGEDTDKFSARPGYSEHQSGFAIDLNSVNYNFITTKEGEWVNNNAYKYGFIIRYPKDKEYITGYKYEPWHIRYVGENLSFKLFRNGEYLTLEEYFNLSSIYKNS